MVQGPRHGRKPKLDLEVVGFVFAAEILMFSDQLFPFKGKATLAWSWQAQLIQLHSEGVQGKQEFMEG